MKRIIKAVTEVHQNPTANDRWQEVQAGKANDS